MPPDITGRFLIAPVRAIRSSRRHLHLVFCQEPVRRPLRLPGVPGAPGAPGPSGPSGPSRPLVLLI